MTKFASYNPHNKPESELMLIMGFKNGSFGRDIFGQLLAADGTGLGSHVSSNESFAVGDLGLTEGSWRKDRQDGFTERYPDGWRTEWVSADDPRIAEAVKLNQKQREEHDQA